MKIIQNSIYLILLFFFSIFIIFPTKAQAVGTGYWHTSGNKILDSNNQQVRISGVNWFGLETGSFAPHGLWSRGYKEMMDQMKQLGFNTIRLPYSNDIFNSVNKPNGIDYSKNPDLQGLSSLQIMDKVVEYANKIGMRVILDRHRPNKDNQSALWYTDIVSEAKWIEDWKSLAKRYKGNTAVIGADIHNEPNSSACWGCGDQSKDWKLAAERAGNAILAENSNWLIIVEGIQAYNGHWYWWGGELEGVRNAPVALNVANRVVYSTHDYPQSVWNQSWFNESNYPSNLPGLWDMIWGYIHKENKAPILIGEFGSKLETQKDQQWYDTLTSYIKTNNISWVYWSWNPNSGDTGGILADDWKTVNLNKQSKLIPLQMTLDSISSIIVTPTSAPSQVLTPSPTKQVSPTSQPTIIATTIPQLNVSTQSAVPKTLNCKVSYVIIESWNNNGFNAAVTIQNVGSQPIEGWNLSWKFAGNQQVKNFWNGNLSQSGQDIKVTNVDWNKKIEAGSSTTIGFVGSYSSSNSIPSPFKINDTQCQ